MKIYHFMSKNVIFCHGDKKLECLKNLAIDSVHPRFRPRKSKIMDFPPQNTMESYQFLYPFK